MTQGALHSCRSEMARTLRKCPFLLATTILLLKTHMTTVAADGIECTDNQAWNDADGRTCADYTADPKLCTSVNGFLQGSHDNCCACNHVPAVTNSPTPLPSQIPSARPTVCYDMASWVDSSGDDCNWYMVPNLNRCVLFGNDYKNMGRTAKNACCSCGGGSYTAFRWVFTYMF